MFKFSEYRLRYFNFRLLLYIWALSAIGLVFIHSATMVSGGSGVTKQIFGIAVGTVAMLFIALVDYHFVLKFAALIYLFNIILLLCVEVFGFAGNSGAQRWVELPGIGTVQPSEFSKIMLILVFAAYFMKFKNKINNIFIVNKF